jgi:hypothetical protein
VVEIPKGGRNKYEYSIYKGLEGKSVTVEGWRSLD